MAQAEITQITLAEGKRRISELALGQQTILSIWSAHSANHSFDTSPLNKGSMGQIVETLIGLTLSTNHIDFTDGELKTSGMIIKDGIIQPKETIAITTIGTRVDDLLITPQFHQSFLHKKIASFLLAAIVQPDKTDRSTWYLGEPVHIKVRQNTPLYSALQEDYELICQKIKAAIEAGGSIRTTSGKYIQIRSKDSKPYHPIYSKKYERDLSTKNYAFYFKKDFITDALAGKFS